MSSVEPEPEPGTPGPAALEARALTKHFGRRAVLRSLDLALEAGRCHVLFGRNGAGKSTFLRLAATIVSPSSGELLYEGETLERLGNGARARIGLVSHESHLYPDLTVRENLEFAARLYGLGDSAGVSEAIEWAGLDLETHAAVRSLSRGMTQRLAVARTLLHRPRLLLLDEPYTGLDTHSADRLTERLRALAGEGTTLVLATHDLERGAALADRVLVMEAGRVVYDARGPVTADAVQKRLAEARDGGRG